MRPKDPMTIALLFNESINDLDIEGISDLMADDYTFIDMENNIEKGEQNGINSWEKFFRLFPDHMDIFDIVMNRDDLVIMIGYSTCSDRRLPSGLQGSLTTR